MEHDGVYKGPAEVVKEQQEEKQCNALIPTQKNNSKIMKNNPYTEICNIKDSNKPTAIAEHDDLANAKRVAAFVRKVIHNKIPKVKAGGPLSLLIESNQSVKISQKELHDIAIAKSAEILARKPDIARQLRVLSDWKKQQNDYYQKFTILLHHINNMNSELELLDRFPNPVAKCVRNVGVNVDLPKRKKDVLVNIKPRIKPRFKP